MHVSNLPQDARSKPVRFPCGAIAFLTPLDTDLAEFDTARRKEIGATILKNLNGPERERLNDWFFKQFATKISRTEHRQLIVFLAAGRVSKERNVPIDVVIAKIIATQSLQPLREPNTLLN